mgnify:CR=1 FL=1
MTASLVAVVTDVIRDGKPLLEDALGTDLRAEGFPARLE